MHESGGDAGREFRRGAVTAFVALLLLSEGVCRIALANGRLFRRVDVSGALTSRADVRDRLRSGPDVVLLGDSVLGPTALHEHGEREPRRASLARAFAGALGKGRTSVSLGADGLLPLDLAALAEEVVRAARPPARALVLVSYRMMSKEAAMDGGASRAFLAPGPPANLETRLSGGLFALATDRSALVRTAQIVKTLWFFPTRTDALQRALTPFVKATDDDADLREAALRMKVAAFYRGAPWSENAAARDGLGAVRDRLAKAGVGAVFVLTPQNFAFAGDVDAGAVARDRAFAKELLGPGSSFADFTDRYPEALFLDHCHLTSAGNEAFARDLVALLEPS